MFINIVINNRKETKYFYIEVDENENLESFIHKFVSTKFVNPVILDIYKYYEYNSKTGDFIPSFVIYQHDVTIKERFETEVENAKS